MWWDEYVADEAVPSAGNVCGCDEYWHAMAIDASLDSMAALPFDFSAIAAQNGSTPLLLTPGVAFFTV